ncbi:MAG: tetratricopeptide repeat protein [Ilumatobacteraceae bacterium]
MTTPDPDRLAELEEERRFLLASIRDLEREHGAGDVDDADYTALHDGYVARAAAVMREIEDGRSSLVPKPQRPLWRRLLVPAVTILVAVALGVAVSQFAGQRLPGQTLTGGLPQDEVTRLLAEARQQLNSDQAAALANYQKVVEIEPDNAEARTYIGWLIVLNGQQTKDQSTVQQGIEFLQQATAIDDTYADPHCFLAVANLRFLDPPQTDTGTQEAQACLDRNPPADMRPMIQSLTSGS